jgi:hypothetical protein
MASYYGGQFIWDDRWVVVNLSLSLGVAFLCEKGCEKVSETDMPVDALLG